MATPDEIRAWMKAKKITQAQLAEKCHTVRLTITRLLQGKPVRPVVMSHIETLMQSSRSLHLQLPEGMVESMRAVAAVHGMTVEDYAAGLLRRALLPLTPMEDEQEQGVAEAAEDSPDA